MKTSLEKALQNKTKTNKSRDTEIETEREPELTHLFKNNSFDFSLYREFLYISHAGFFFMCGVPLTHPVLASSFISREYPSHIPCCLHFYLGSFSYTSHACFVFLWGVSLTHPMLAFFLSFFFFLIQGVSLTDPVLASFPCGEFLLHIPYRLYFLSGEFLLHIPCLLYFSVGSFSYTSHAGFSFKVGGDGVLLHIPYWLYFNLRSFSYTSHACFLCGEFLLHIPCWLFFFFSLMWRETQFSLYFYLGSFSYTSHADFFHFFFIFSSSFFIAGSFSCTSRTGFISIWGVSLTHPMLALFFCGVFLLHIPCWLFFFF